MPLKIRQKKNKTASQGARHPKYQYAGNTGKHWADQYREDNKSGYRKSFVAIICVMVAIVLLLILAAVNTVIDATGDTDQQITAADTFAVSGYEQQQMQDAAYQFAEGVLVYAYCSDQETALQGKNAALQVMAQGTEAYTSLEEMEPVASVIAPQNFVPVITTPELRESTRAYAGSFTYEFDGVAADSSVTSEENPDATFADSGYHFIITFDYVTDDATGDEIWVITNVQIEEKESADGDDFDYEVLTQDLGNAGATEGTTDGNTDATEGTDSVEGADKGTGDELIEEEVLSDTDSGVEPDNEAFEEDMGEGENIQ